MKTHTRAVLLAVVVRGGLVALAACAGASAPATPAAPFGLPTSVGAGGRQALLSYSVPCYVAQGGANIVAASGCTVSVESGGTINVESGGILDLASGATVTGVISNDMNGGALYLDPNQSTILRAATNGLATFTLPATGTFQVTTGNLRVGNGSNGTTLNGKDAYIEGTLEVDGVSNFAGHLTALDDILVGGGTPTITQNGGDIYVTDQLEVDGEAQFDGAIDANGTVDFAAAVVNNSTLSQGGALTILGAVLSPRAAITATTGALVSTGFFQPLTSSGTVTPTITPGTTGTTTCFYNTSATSIVFVDTGNVVLSGDFTLGQYDMLCGRSDGTRWIEFSETDN